MEDDSVKHLSTITVPRKADKFQEFICSKAVILNDILGAFGGESPITGYVVEKCDIPEPLD
jgi:hypothetical protein